MTDLFFNSADELKEAFGIDNLPGYENYTAYKNRKVGFSVQRQYPPDIRYKPPKRKDGTPDTVALIKVVYFHPSEVNKPIDPSKVPLSIGIFTHSRYLINHFEYNFDDEECPTEQSVLLSKSTPRPIALDSYEEYFYDHHQRSFINKDRVSLTGKEILENVFQLHCDTIRMVKGLGLRSKLYFRSLGQSACSKIIQICKWLLRIAFGRNLSSKEFMVGYLKEYKREDMKFNDSDKIKVFGYQASKNVIITFSITVLSAYSIAYVLKDKSQYLSNITKNPLLVICGALLVLWVVDYILPNLLFWAINLFIKIGNRLAFMKFKI